MSKAIELKNGDKVLFNANKVVKVIKTKNEVAMTSDSPIRPNINYLQPCYKYEGATIYQQLNKIKEELQEVQEAAANYTTSESKEDQEALAMETADVIVCCTTLLHQIGLNEAQRKLIYKKVWQKNDRRGYYSRGKKATFTGSTGGQK